MKLNQDKYHQFVSVYKYENVWTKTGDEIFSGNNK